MFAPTTSSIKSPLNCSLHDYVTYLTRQCRSSRLSPRLAPSFSIMHAVCLACLTLWMGSTAAFRNINLLCFFNSTFPTVQVVVCFCCAFVILRRQHLQKIQDDQLCWCLHRDIFPYSYSPKSLFSQRHPRVESVHPKHLFYCAIGYFTLKPWLVTQ